MKKHCVIQMIRGFAVSLLCLLLSIPAAFAGAADSVHGIWVADIDATLVELSKTRRDAMRDYEMDDLKATLAALRMEIDIPGMYFLEKGPNGSEASFTIEKIEEDGDTIRILGDHRRYSCTVRPDGKLHMGSGVVMRRLENGAAATGAGPAQPVISNRTPGQTLGQTLDQTAGQQPAGGK